MLRLVFDSRDPARYHDMTYNKLDALSLRAPVSKPMSLPRSSENCPFLVACAASNANEMVCECKVKHKAGQSQLRRFSTICTKRHFCEGVPNDLRQWTLLAKEENRYCLT